MIYIYISVYIYIYMYICMHIHICLLVQSKHVCSKLQDPKSDRRQILHARENAKGNVVIAGLQAPAMDLSQGSLSFFF